MEDPRMLPVAVVGAGPAGCSAAIALARAGLPVTLFERGAPGKDKVCGDAYSATAASLLAGYGIDAARLGALGGLPYHEMELRSQHGHVWHLRTGTESLAEPGWLIRRAIMDQHLRDLTAAWATVRYGCTVTGIVSEPGAPLRLSLRTGGEPPTVFPCRGLILACGAAGPLPRHWGLSGEPRVSASVSAYTTGLSGRRSDGLAIPVPVFEFKACCRPGYVWTFPLANGQTNFGVCTLAKPTGQPLARLALEHAHARGLSPHGRLRGAREATWSGKGQRWHHPAGILSCGDAAGLGDPDTGEGIAAALLSGERAGSALAGYLVDGCQTSHLEDYSHWVLNHFSDAYQPGSFRRIWAALASNT